jgi:protein O-mannosyl-transferase
LLYWRLTVLRSRSATKRSPIPEPKQGIFTAPGKWTIRAALVAIALAAYSNSFGLGLALDSNLLVQDQRIHEVSPTNLGLILTTHYWWPEPADRLYRPVTTASFLLNYAILGNGPRPAGYHVLNFLLHAAGVLLVFELALLLFGRAGPAFFAAALWGVHPVGTESVTNVAGRADLLATVALLAALLWYARTGGRPKPRALAGLFGLALLAVFSKETGAVLVGLMLLWDLTRGVRPRVPAYLAALAPLAILWWARLEAFRDAPWPKATFVDNPLLGAGFWVSRFTALKVIGMDLALLVWPARLSADRSYNQIPMAGWSDFPAWISLAAVAAILAVVLMRYRKDRVLFWSAGFFGLALLPASNLVVRIGSIMAERFLYLPAIGFAVAAAALFYRHVPRRAIPYVAGAVLVLCAGRTFARNPAWNDSLTLAAADVQSAPGSFRLHDMLGEYLYLQDPKANLDRAIEELEAAWSVLRVLPPERIFEANPATLGMYYGVKGDAAGGPQTKEGRGWYEKSLRTLLQARDASRATQKAFDEAQGAHGRPLDGFVAYPPLYGFLGVTELRLGRYPEAIEAYRYAVVLNPRNGAGYDSLANAYLSAGDPAGAAIVLLEKGLELGFNPPTLAALRSVYAEMPGGQCAVRRSGGIDQLDPECPRVHSDICKAEASLAELLKEARRPARVSDSGCPASR